MNREEWLDHAWAWKREYADNIHAQWAKIGIKFRLYQRKIYSR